MRSFGFFMARQAVVVPSDPVLTLSDGSAFSGGRFVNGTATSPTLTLLAGAVRTVEFFWTPTASTGGKVVVGFHDGSGTAQELFVYAADAGGPDGQVKWQFGPSGTNVGGVTPGTECHVEVAVDPAGEARWFLGGVLQQAISYPGITVAPVLTVAVDGGTPVEGGAGFGGNGAIRDLRISSVKRHTESFAPPTSLSRDEHTLYYWPLATNGSGA